ncbi:MAG: acyl dehydratase [Acidimicrobiales bacterium]|jgi:acyl dehydratase
MVISTSLVGMTVDNIEHDVDERWTMAYAAALGDHLPDYFDTTRPTGVVAHPLFAVCPEWPVIVASRSHTSEFGVTPAEVLTSIHATHDTTIHRLVRPGDRLQTSLELVGLEQIGPGAKSTMRIQTVDANSAPVATTTQDGIYLGQQSIGDALPDTGRPDPLLVERHGDPVEIDILIAAGAAHTYTECARIWNPIHTDKAVALASGLPDIILHGTANLAHGVTAVVAQRAQRRPELVRRISCRFAAMVRLPSTITVRVWPAQEHPDGLKVAFEVLNADGEPAVKDGVVLLGEVPR